MIKTYWTCKPGDLPYWYGRPDEPMTLPDVKSDMLEFRLEPPTEWSDSYVGVYLGDTVVAWYRRDGEIWDTRIGRCDPKSKHGSNVCKSVNSEEDCLKFIGQQIRKWVKEETP
jgi:hypothetical protein